MGLIGSMGNSNRQFAAVHLMMRSADLDASRDLERPADPTSGVTSDQRDPGNTFGPRTQRAATLVA